MKTITMGLDVAEYVRDLVQKERDRAHKAAGKTKNKTVRRARLVEVDLANVFLLLTEERAAVTPGGASLAEDAPRVTPGPPIEGSAEGR